MDKASKALRRSSIRLKSFSSGHGELNMVISDLDHVRSTAKSFLSAQQTMVQDMMEWASKERNIAIQETLSLLGELSVLWSESQKEFIDQLKKVRQQFDMILEGEKSVDKARAHLTACEQREAKLKKELKKGSVPSVDESKKIESKLKENKASIDQAQMDVSEQVNENEVVKLIRFKNGLSYLSEFYLELAFKCNVIFEAHRTVVFDIPAGQDKKTDLQNMVFTGSKFAKSRVLEAKESVKNYKQNLALRSSAPASSDLPPPYTPSCSQNSSFTSPSPSANQNIYSSHTYDQLSDTRTTVNHRYDEVHSDSMRYENLPDSSSASASGRYSNVEVGQYGFQVGNLYEQDVAGAVNNMHIK